MIGDPRPMAADVRVRSVEAALVHNGLNDEVIDWKPELHQSIYEQYAHPEFNPGVTEWDGRLLDAPRRTTGRVNCMRLGIQCG